MKYCHTCCTGSRCNVNSAAAGHLSSTLVGLLLTGLLVQRLRWSH